MSAEEPTATNDTVNTLKTENFILPSGITGSKKKNTANTKVRTEKDGPEIVYEDLSPKKKATMSDFQSVTYFSSLSQGYQDEMNNRITLAGVNRRITQIGLAKATFAAGGEKQWWSVEQMSKEFGGNIKKPEKVFAEVVEVTSVASTVVPKKKGSSNKSLTYDPKKKEIHEIPASVMRQGNGGIVKGYDEVVLYLDENNKPVKGKRVEFATPGPGTPIEELTDAQLKMLSIAEPDFGMVLRDREAKKALAKNKKKPK